MINTGDRVVCVDASNCKDSDGNTPGLVEGRDYIIYSIDKQCSCEEVVNVGIACPIYGHRVRCATCLDQVIDDGIWWLDHTRFRKIEETINYVKIEIEEVIEIEEPILN